MSSDPRLREQPIHWKALGNMRKIKTYEISRWSFSALACIAALSASPNLWGAVVEDEGSVFTTHVHQWYHGTFERRLSLDSEMAPAPLIETSTVSTEAVEIGSPKKLPLRRAISDVQSEELMAEGTHYRAKRFTETSDVEFNESLAVLIDFADSTRATVPTTGQLGVANDCLQLLVETSQGALALGNYMIQTITDESVDLVWREYLIQYLPNYYTAVKGSEAMNKFEKASMKRNIQRLLARTLTHTCSPLGSTALIAIAELSVNHAEFATPSVSSIAQKLVINASQEPVTCNTFIITSLGLINENDISAEFTQAVQTFEERMQGKKIFEAHLSRFLASQAESN